MYTHLDIVHVKIYAIHTPASCQVPREPVVTALAAGEQRALLNIHSKVYVHMYTYVQTPPPAPGHWTQARPRTHNPWKPLSVLNFLLLKEEGAGEKRKTGVWSAGTVASPRSPKDQRVPHLLRGESCLMSPGGSGRPSACVCVCETVCEHLVGVGERVRLCSLGPRPQRLRRRSCWPWW